MKKRIVINGVEASFEDFKLLNRFKHLKKIDIVFKKISKNFINIITK